jgi:hypothetical protein
MMGLPRSVADALDVVTYSRRALAYLQIDAHLKLVSAGGALENYGLDALRPGEPALDQAFFLEGILPVQETPYLMPSIEIGGGRAADLHFYQDGKCVWVILLDVTSERDQMRGVQQKAYEMTLLQEKEALLNRQLEAANAALLATQTDLKSSRESLLRVIEELRALGEVSEAVNSTLDLQTVLNTIVARAVQISGTEAGAIYVFDDQQKEFQLSTTFGMSDEMIAAVRDMHAEISATVSFLTETHGPSQTADLRDLPSTPVNEIILRAGYRARLLVPMVRSGKVVGALVVRRKAPGEFSANTVE